MITIATAATPALGLNARTHMFLEGPIVPTILRLDASNVLVPWARNDMRIPM